MQSTKVQLHRSISTSDITQNTENSLPEAISIDHSHFTSWVNPALI